ncbi:MAG: PDZ domain-containing protein [Myxococcales bacterium]
MARWGDGEVIRIDFVALPSPAGDAGLRPGDALHRLDGQAVGARDLDRVRRALREASAAPILEIGRLGPALLRLRTLV